MHARKKFATENVRGRHVSDLWPKLLSHSRESFLAYLRLSPVSRFQAPERRILMYYINSCTTKYRDLKIERSNFGGFVLGYIDAEFASKYFLFSKSCKFCSFMHRFQIQKFANVDNLLVILSLCWSIVSKVIQF